MRLVAESKKAIDRDVAIREPHRVLGFWGCGGERVVADATPEERAPLGERKGSLLVVNILKIDHIKVNIQSGLLHFSRKPEFPYPFGIKFYINNRS
jgi:hypothetical protein